MYGLYLKRNVYGVSVNSVCFYQKEKQKVREKKIERQRIKRFQKSSVVNIAPRADCHSAKITKFQTFIFIPLGDDKRSVAVSSIELRNWFAVLQKYAMHLPKSK